MFTGLVEACVPVALVEPRGTGLRVALPRPSDGWEAAEGDSVAVSGVCLTVAGFGPEGELLFDLSAETLERSWLSDLAAGDLLNLERSLRLGDRLGGHLVSGHVDGLGSVSDVRESGDGGRVLSFEVDGGFERYLVEKGSVTIDGISLTVVEPRGRTFDVALIPVTLETTTLGRARVGQRVNLEADMIGKWIERLLPARD